jgi:hypothetical protein
VFGWEILPLLVEVVCNGLALLLQLGRNVLRLTDDAEDIATRKSCEIVLVPPATEEDLELGTWSTWVAYRRSINDLPGWGTSTRPRVLWEGSVRHHHSRFRVQH